MMDCQFPQNTARTAYNKGCRCDRCRDAIREQAARYREALRANPEREAQYREMRRAVNARYQKANREVLRQRAALYQSAHPDAVREAQARYREANRGWVRSEDRARHTAKQALTKVYATRIGARWTGDEDQALHDWRQTDAALAIALGRTLSAVRARRRRTLAERLA